MTEPFTRRLPAGIPLAVVAVVGWVVLEVLVRRGFAAAGDAALGSAIVGDWLALLVGLPVVAAVLSRYAVRGGQSRADWEYDWDRRSVAIGLAAGVFGIALAAVGAQVDAALFDTGSMEGAAGAFTATIEAAPWVAVVLLLGNGVAAPVAEERVWRAIVQTDLVDRWGAVTGIAVTAVLFSLKHAVVDLSLARLTTIVLLGLLWGGLRHRWGTASSTVAHVVTNVVSTSLVIVTALG